MRIYYRTFGIAAILIFAASMVSSQTGDVSYSESKAYDPRELPIPEKPKKEKKQKPSDRSKSAESALPPAIETEPKPLTIPVSVFDKDGKMVTGLQASDFKVFIDDVEQTMVSAEVRSEPINIVLVLDMSPSTQTRIKEMQRYARDLVNQLQPDDKVMVVSFDEKMSVLTDMTSDRKKIEKGISKQIPGDGTSLYETIDELFSKRISMITGRKAVIIFTDGKDTTSRRSTYESSLIAAEKSDASVYPIYWDTSKDIPQLKGLPPRLDPMVLMSLPRRSPSPEPYPVEVIGLWFLNDLVKLSGGRAISYEDVKKGNFGLSASISQELHDQYVLTVLPSKSQNAGQRKKIRVRVNRPNLFLLARGSYIP